MTTREASPRDRGMRPRTTRPGRGRFVPKRKVCYFCANKNEVIDYKNADKLRGYLSDRAKIEPRRRSGICAKHQRALATAIKRARHLALLPFVPEHMFTIPRIVTAPAPVVVSIPAPAPASAPAPMPLATPESTPAPGPTNS